MLCTAQQTVIIILITIDRIERGSVNGLTYLLPGLGIRVALHQSHEEEKGTDGHGIIRCLLGDRLAQR